MPKYEGLSPKHKAFADYYIKLGNASEAAKKAGYKPNSAKVTGARLLTDVNISQYISERMESQDAERVASADEVIQFYTAVMRGEVKDQFGLEAALTERLKAADSLMKRYAAADDKQRMTMAKLDNLFREFRDAVNAETD